jgi:hypothetical protein
MLITVALHLLPVATPCILIQLDVREETCPERIFTDDVLPVQ